MRGWGNARLDLSLLSYHTWVGGEAANLGEFKAQHAPPHHLLTSCTAEVAVSMGITETTRFRELASSMRNPADSGIGPGEGCPTAAAQGHRARLLTPAMSSRMPNWTSVLDF